MIYPEYSPRDSTCILTDKEREWADELRDEFIIIANKHFTNIIDPSKEFLDELTDKFTEFLRLWIDKNPIIQCHQDQETNELVLNVTDMGVMNAIRQARNELCQYLSEEFGDIDV